jgi:hypothetical protein
MEAEIYGDGDGDMQRWRQRYAETEAANMFIPSGYSFISMTFYNLL